MQKSIDALSWVLVLCLSLSTMIMPLRAENEMQPNVQANATGQISGIVTDTEGHPLTNVTVNAYQDLNGNGDWQWVSFSYTDATGAYTLCCLAAGIYRLEFYSQTHYSDFYDNAATVTLATDITVVSGVTTGNRNAQLAQKGRIRGRVTDQRGAALKNIGVSTYYDPNDARVWLSRGYTSTDGNGAYTLEGLERGSYRIEFLGYSGRLNGEFYQNAPTLETATTLKVNDNTVEHIDAQLDGPTGRIQGVVTNENNEPLLEADVAVYQDSDQNGVWEWMASDVTDANGGYQVAALWDGAYRVQFSDFVDQYRNCPFQRYAIQYYADVDNFDAATNLVIQAGNTIANISARLVAAGQIQGRVTDTNNNPIPNLRVIAFSNPMHSLPCFSSTTASDGTYALGAADGLFRIFFRTGPGLVPYVSHTAEYYDNVASFEAATDMHVVARTIITGVDAQLAPAGTIRGVVTDLNGVRLPQIKVTAYVDADGDGQWQPFAVTETDPAGAYALPGVGGDSYSPVAYRVSFEDLRTPPQYHAKVYPSADYPESGQDVRVATHEEVRNINGLLPPFDAVNLAPLAHDDRILLFQDGETSQWFSASSVLANDRDAEAESLQAVLVDPPGQGALTLNADGTFTYTPNASAWISDIFTYRAHDQSHESNLATVTIVLVADRLFLPVVRR